jgi:hypothetical protein
MRCKLGNDTLTFGVTICTGWKSSALTSFLQVYITLQSLGPPGSNQNGRWRQVP